MSKYLKTYEEWNPFLSKEEKAKRAEESKRKEEEEKARLAEEEKKKKQELVNKKKEEGFKRLDEIGEELVKYNPPSLSSNNGIKIELDYKSDSGFISYDVDFNTDTFRLLKNRDISDIDFKITLSAISWDGFKPKLRFDIKISIPKTKLDIPNNILEELKNKRSILGDNRIHINSYSTRIEFNISVSEEVSESNLNQILNRFLGSYSTNSLDQYIHKINYIYDLVDKLKEQSIKREDFKKNTDNIMDCFAEIIDMCYSHSSEYIEKENYYMFVFNIKGVKPKSQPPSKYTTITKSGLYLNDKILEFFYLLSEAKPRVNDIVPNCEFDVDIEPDKITLIVK